MKPTGIHSLCSVAILVGLVSVDAKSDSLVSDNDEPKVYASLGIGAFNAGSESGQIPDRKGVFTWMGNVGYRRSRHLSFEADFQGIYQRSDVPLTVAPPFLGTVDSIDIDSMGLSGLAKLRLPYQAFAPYVGAGLGLYHSTLTVNGTLFGLPADQEETDLNIGYQLVVGVDIRIAETKALALEYRRLYLKGNFGSVTNGEVDIGGGSIIGILRFGW